MMIIIFYPERRINSLLVNSSCIVLPYLLFFLFFPHALLILKNMNVMNMKIQGRCLNSLYLKVKAIATIHPIIPKWIENLIIMHTWILFRHDKFCEDNKKKMRKIPLCKTLISQFKIIIEPESKNWRPTWTSAAFVKKRKSKKVSWSPYTSNVSHSDTSRKETWSIVLKKCNFWNFSFLFNVQEN